jgi:hypothetical protein
MYDPLETSISKSELLGLLEKCREMKSRVAIIGGWATFFHVNKNYNRAFGKDYMGSRDIDIFVDASTEKEFSDIIKELGFEANGLPFRYEKIYDRVNNKFIKNSEIKELYNIIYIFLDVFSNAETKTIRSWHTLEPLKALKVEIVDGIEVADIATLVQLKCISIFARDKADKENKDACDLFALLFYGGKKVPPTLYLKRAVEKIIGRDDLLYMIAEHVFLDPAKQSIVLAQLKKFLSSNYR